MNTPEVAPRDITCGECPGRERVPTDPPGFVRCPMQDALRPLNTSCTIPLEQMVQGWNRIMKLGLVIQNTIHLREKKKGLGESPTNRAERRRKRVH